MTKKVKFDVFISYRRSGGSALAQLVRENLTRRGYRVFVDVRDLRAGQFDRTLMETVTAAKDVVVLVTRGCFQRCQDPDDWFRQEIETALASTCNVIPLRSDDARLPDPDELPSSLASLPKHQCVTFNSEFCDAGMERLSSMLRSRPRMTRRLVPPLLALAVVLAIALGVLWIIAHPDYREPLVLHWFGQGQRQLGGQWQDFPLYNGMTMYSGDQFRLSFVLSTDCYVYVVGIDSRGERNILFPSQLIAQNHYCLANRQYDIPDGDNFFTLDENTGQEQLYLLASRTPLELLEGMLTPDAVVDHQQAALVLDETARQLAQRSRGVEIQPDQRVTITTSVKGRKFQQEMNYVAGQGATVQLLRFVHAPRP